MIKITLFMLIMQNIMKIIKFLKLWAKQKLRHLMNI